MKKIICMVILLLTTICTYGQERFIIGGNISVSTTGGSTKIAKEKTDKPTNLSFEILPSFHYMVSDRVAIGTSIGYKGTKQEKGETKDDKLYSRNNQFVIEPSVIYYVPLGNKFNYAPMAFVGIATGKHKEDITTRKQNETTLTDFSLGIRLARFEFKPIPKVGIIFSCGELSYESQVNKDNDNSDTNTGFNFSLNIAPTLGFMYYF